MSLPKKAVLLAAGFGKRMDELTLEVPKPLVPFQGIPLLYYTLNFLEKLGIKEVYCNLYYQKEVLAQELKRIEEKTDFLFFTTIEDSLYGSAGGLENLISTYSELDEYVLINCDILFQYTPQALTETKKLWANIKNSDGLLLLTTNDGNQTGIVLDQKNQVGFSAGGDYQYIGLSVWGKNQNNFIPKERPYELRPVWEDMAAAKRITGGLCSFPSFSVGTKVEWSALNKQYQTSNELQSLVQSTQKFASNYGLGLK